MTRQPAAPPLPAPRPTEPEFCYLYLAGQPLTPPNPQSAVVQCSPDRLGPVQRALAWLYVPAAQGGDPQQVYLVYRNRDTWQAAEHAATQMVQSPPPILDQLLAELRPSGLVAPSATEPLAQALLQAQDDAALSELWRWSAAMWRGRLLFLQRQDAPAAAEAFAVARRIARSASPEDLAASAAWIEMLAQQDQLAEARSALTQLQQRCESLMDSAAGRRVQQLVRDKGQR